MRKSLVVALCSLALLGCKANKNLELVVKEQSVKITQPYKKVSYKLEDLCDTELYEKNITLHVYIEPSDILWDYHEYKEEIFGYVKNFFREQQVNCKIAYSPTHFTKFTKPNEFGIEIWDSKEDIEKRYWQLLIEDEISKEHINLFYDSSHAATRAQIALIKGEHKSTSGLSKEQIKELLFGIYKDKDSKEFILKSLAAHSCHEILRCMMLFHTDAFNISPVEELDTPNIMYRYSDRIPKIQEDCVLGYSLTTLQKRLIHSFIAGNNSHKAFLDSQRDLLFFLENLAEANNLKLN